MTEPFRNYLIKNQFQRENKQNYNVQYVRTSVKMHTVIIIIEFPDRVGVSQKCSSSMLQIPTGKKPHKHKYNVVISLVFPAICFDFYLV